MSLRKPRQSRRCIDCGYLNYPKSPVEGVCGICYLTKPQYRTAPRRKRWVKCCVCDRTIDLDNVRYWEDDGKYYCQKCGFEHFTKEKVQFTKKGII